MLRYFLLFLVLASLTLAGCGGGGGGPERFTYVTQWTTPSGGIDGQSQRIQLFDQNNVLRYSAVLDKPTSARIIFGVLHGTYHLHVDLYAQQGQNGGIVGVLDDVVTVSSSRSYSTTVGPAVTNVRLSPTSATIQVLHSKQFYATSQTAANVPTFTAPGGFNWQTLGGVATVDQNGLVVGDSPGPGSVTAQDLSASVTGAATLTITSNSTSHSKWTVIVFMNAANNLYLDSILNMNQMEKVAQNSEVRFVVQWKQSTNVQPGSTFNSTRRYLVKPDTTSAIASEIIQDLGPGYDMGSAANMLDFITWAKTNYSADHYCVVIWNHGNGWTRAPGDFQQRGVSYDDETGNHIDTWQFSQALGNGVNDIVAWDASLMQQLEVAEEIRDKATYVVGSEESPPEQGYPYDTVFAHFRDNPDAPVLTLAHAFVDETLAFYAGSSSVKITQSVIDTSQLPGLVTATSSLADAMIANQGALTTIVPTVRSTAQRYSDDDFLHRHYRDLYDVCLKLEASAGIPLAVASAAANVRTAIGQAVVYEGHNNNSPGSHGISIDFSSSTQFAPVALDYQNLRFAQETNWDQWLSVAP